MGKSIRALFPLQPRARRSASLTAHPFPFPSGPHQLSSTRGPRPCCRGAEGRLRLLLLSGDGQGRMDVTACRLKAEANLWGAEQRSMRKDARASVGAHGARRGGEKPPFGNRALGCTASRSLCLDTLGPGWPVSLASVSVVAYVSLPSAPGKHVQVALRRCGVYTRGSN